MFLGEDLNKDFADKEAGKEAGTEAGPCLELEKRPAVIVEVAVGAVDDMPYR